MADKIKITADFIEQLSYISDNRWMKTDEFRRALMDFRESGFSTRNTMEYTAEEALRIIKRKQDSQ